MIKSKLMKAIMLGICLSAFTTGVAYAQMVTGIGQADAGTSSVAAGTTVAADAEPLSPELEALYAKQKEIDQYIFKDHAKDMEDKGIFVSYTGVNGTAVEIGISPYTDENVNYLYEIFGKDGVMVVEYDQSVIYETTVVSDPAIGALPQKGEAYPVVPAPDSSVSKETIPEPAVDNAANTDGEVRIQIESTTAVSDTGSDMIDKATAEDVNPASAGVITNSEEEASNMLISTVDKVSESVSAPVMVLIIAVGAALLGGAIIITVKKKAVK